MPCGERTPDLDTANSIAGALGKSLPEMLVEAEKTQAVSSRKLLKRVRP